MFGISKSSAIIAVLLVIFSESICCSEILSKIPLLDGRVTETVINWQTSYPGESLICVGSTPTRRPVNELDDISGDFKFRVYKASGNGVEMIYELLGEELLYAYPLKPDGTGRLLAVFTGVTTFRVMIFGYIDNKVTLLLKTGGTAFQELAYDDKGNELLIVSDDDRRDGGISPLIGDTHIYRWNGKQYERFGPFSIKTRFDKIKHFVSGKKIPKKWRYEKHKSPPSSSPCGH